MNDSNEETITTRFKPGDIVVWDDAAPINAVTSCASGEFIDRKKYHEPRRVSTLVPGPQGGWITFSDEHLTGRTHYANRFKRFERAKELPARGVRVGDKIICLAADRPTSLEVTYISDRGCRVGRDGWISFGDEGWYHADGVPVDWAATPTVPAASPEVTCTACIGACEEAAELKAKIAQRESELSTCRGNLQKEMQRAQKLGDECGTLKAQLAEAQQTIGRLTLEGARRGKR